MTLRSTPLGIQAIQKAGCCPRDPVTKTRLYKAYILIFTFFCYASYHLSRKPISVVKNVLHQNCTQLNTTKDCSWKPFDHANYKELEGTLDTSFLFAYAAGMFLSGHMAERMNLRYFLSFGMLLSGFFTAAMGFGYFLGIHTLTYYIVMQILGGAVQSTGWPAVVTCVANWYGKGRRGFIMGVWNSHTSVGNILGSIIPGLYVQHAWGWSFVVPALIISAMGFLVWLFLVPNPHDVDCLAPVQNPGSGDLHSGTELSPSTINSSPDSTAVPQSPTAANVQVETVPPNEARSSAEPLDKEQQLHTETRPNTCSNSSPHQDDTFKDVSLINVEETETRMPGSDEEDLLPAIDNDGVEHQAHRAPHHIRYEERAISALGALQIPGVFEFSICLFFGKLVSYTFLFWLPNYIQFSTNFGAERSALLSTIFDVGGIFGGIIAGIVADQTGGHASVCVVMLALAAPSLYIYNVFGSNSLGMSIGMLILCGVLVNGPYALITTAVSADLGTHPSLRNSAKALATVTAIIDGTGSIGAALGPLLTGVISSHGSWRDVFYMLIAADIIAMICLFRILYKEMKRCRRWFHNRRQSSYNSLN